jgi:hypothetical protein
MNCPATPQKKSRKNENMEAAVESPYFQVNAPKRRNLLESQLEKDEEVFEMQASFKLFLGTPPNTDSFERTTSLVSINHFV